MGPEQVDHSLLPLMTGVVIIVTGLVSALPPEVPLLFHSDSVGVSIVKYACVWDSAPLCSCVVLHRRMTSLVPVYLAAGGRGYKATLLLQKRQELLLESHLGSWDGDLCWPVEP